MSARAKLSVGFNFKKTSYFTPPLPSNKNTKEH